MTREIMYNNFEISLVVFMPNITTNHAITYTNTTVDIFCLFYFHVEELSNFRIPRISARFNMRTRKTEDRPGLNPIRAPLALLSLQSKIVKISQENLTLFSHAYFLKHHNHHCYWIEDRRRACSTLTCFNCMTSPVIVGRWRWFVTLTGNLW